MEILLLIGIGVGLASVAGLRAFFPLALVGAFALAGLFELPASFGFLADPVVLVALFVLVIVEGFLDKAAPLQFVSDVVMTPLRILSGALLFAAATGAGLDAAAVPELAAGGLIAGAVAAARIFLRPASSGSGVSPAFLSAMEDVVAVVGGILAVFVAFLPLALVAFVLFFFYRVRKRRGRKYEGLRILGD
jgi:GNAT superfamily N-acetyltransferase